MADKENKGQFKEGNKGGGRKKGSKNKLTYPVKESIADFVNGEIETILDRVEEMSLRDRANFVAKLLPYIVPRQKEVKAKIELETEPTEKQVYKLSDGQIIDFS